MVNNEKIDLTGAGRGVHKEAPADGVISRSRRGLIDAPKADERSFDYI